MANFGPTTRLVNDDQPLTLFGQKTPRAVIYKSESHKLHQAFCVKKGSKIVQGMPVALGQDGLIEPYIPGGDGSQIYLGVAVTDNINPAYGPQRNYPVEVTVAVEGYMICNWVAVGAFYAGYVRPMGTLLNDRFIIAESQVDETKFIALNPTEEANEVVQVLIR